MDRLSRMYFYRDVLEVAQDLPGHFICRKNKELIERFLITEVEAYRGEEDKACHASKGRTKRTEIMYHEGGLIYVYLVYGLHWMLNVVCGQVNKPQAVLIRGLKEINGPGRIAKHLKIDQSFYGEDIENSTRIWITNIKEKHTIKCGRRIGIDYAGEEWANKKWRFFISSDN